MFRPRNPVPREGGGTHIEFLEHDRVLAPFAPTLPALRILLELDQLLLPIIIQIHHRRPLRVRPLQLNIDAVPRPLEDLRPREVRDAERVVHGRAVVEAEDFAVGVGEKVEEGVEGVPEGGVGPGRGGGGLGEGVWGRVDESVGVGGAAAAEEGFIVVRAEDGLVSDVQGLARMSPKGQQRRASISKNFRGRTAMITGTSAFRRILAA